MPAKTNINLILRAVSVFTVLLLVAIMAWLSLTDDDPCGNPQANVSAAVLADQDGDQDALVNRAIVIKGKCKED